MKKIFIVTKLKKLITYSLIVLASLIFIITYLAVTLAKESYTNKYLKNEGYEFRNMYDVFSFTTD